MKHWLLASIRFSLSAKFRAGAHLPGLTENAWARTLSSDRTQGC